MHAEDAEEQIYMTQGNTVQVRAWMSNMIGCRVDH